MSSANAKDDEEDNDDEKEEKTEHLPNQSVPTASLKSVKIALSNQKQRKVRIPPKTKSKLCTIAEEEMEQSHDSQQIEMASRINIEYNPSVQPVEKQEEWSEHEAE